MNPLFLMVALVAAVAVLCFVYMSESSPEQAAHDEEKSVDEETPEEIKQNLKDFAEESEEIQSPEEKIGYGEH